MNSHTRGANCHEGARHATHNERLFRDFHAHWHESASHPPENERLCRNFHANCHEGANHIPEDERPAGVLHATPRPVRGDGRELTASSVPVIGFVAPSGTGKTTLIRRMVPLLRQRGLRVGYLKHSHHHIEVDHPGKDSYEIREAGASQVLIATGSGWIMQSAQRQANQDPDLAEMLALFDPQLVDLILVEGFKYSAYPKLEVHRAALGKSYLYCEDPDIRALISDAPPPAGEHPPLLPLGAPLVIVNFILSDLI